MSYGQGAGVCFATAVFVCGVAGFPVAPSTVPPAQGTIVLDNVSSTTVHAGEKVRISGSGFASRAAVTVSIYSAPQDLAHVIANKSGRVSTNIVIPQSLRGNHTLSAIGDGPGRTARALNTDIVVTTSSIVSPPTGPHTSGLPATGLGFNLALYAIAGLMLILAGLILVRGAMMRRPMLPRQ